LSFKNILNRLGRKTLLTIPLLIGGVLMLCTLLVPSSSDSSVVLSILSIIGIIACGASFDTGYLFTKELFPTTLR